MKCPHTSHVQKVIGLSACSDMVATAIVFEISRLCQMYTFPDQMMNCQFVLIRIMKVILTYDSEYKGPSFSSFSLVST